MFAKILPILAIGVWAISGTADDMTVDSSAPIADCPTSCPKSTPCPAPSPNKVAPKSDKPAPAKATSPAASSPASCPAKPCAPAPCAAPCPPAPCCKPSAPCCWNFNPCNPKGCTDMNCGGFYLSADFLYWRSENHGFSAAYELQTTVPAGQNVGKIIRVNPHWAPAFRVGLGWNTTYDFWDIFLDYTWYQNRSHRHKASTVGFLPLWPVASASTGQYGNMTAHSRFGLNMGDVEIGRLLYLTKTLAIRPHWGARGGAIHQKFRDFFSARLSGAYSEERFSGRNNYWGIGPRTGVNGEWHLSQGFSVLGKVAGALLYGSTHTKSLHRTLATSATAYALERQYEDRFSQLVPNLQLALGFQWQTCFWCEKMFFKMSAAWETNYWWDQFNLPFALVSNTAPFPTVGNQPLTMEGLTLNFEWDF